MNIVIDSGALVIFHGNTMLIVTRDLQASKYQTAMPITLMFFTFVITNAMGVTLLDPKPDDFENATRTIKQEIDRDCPDGTIPENLLYSTSPDHVLMFVQTGPRVIPTLMEMLGSHNVGYRITALEALTCLAEERSSMINILLLTDDTFAVRQAAAENLNNIYPLAPTRLAELLKLNVNNLTVAQEFQREIMAWYLSKETDNLDKQLPRLLPKTWKPSGRMFKEFAGEDLPAAAIRPPQRKASPKPPKSTDAERI